MSPTEPTFSIRETATCPCCHLHQYTIASGGSWVSSDPGKRGACEAPGHVVKHPGFYRTGKPDSQIHSIPLRSDRMTNLWN